MRIRCALLGLTFVVIGALATAASAMEHRTQLSLGTDTDAQTVALAWNSFWTCCDAPRFRVGSGIRWSAFHGRDLVLETAEYDLIEAGETTSISNVNAQIYSFNAFVSAGFKAFDWLYFGFNLDIVGVSLGPNQNASYGESGFNPTPKIHPMHFNLFRWGLRDIGTLNSEFFAEVPMNETWGIRLGLSHFFAEMESTEPLKYTGDRFRTIRNLALLSVAYDHK